MKIFFYTLIALFTVSFAANAQNKNMEMKKKFNFMQRFHRLQNFNSTQNLKLKINPYWRSIEAPHAYNTSYMPQISVPAYNSMWGLLVYDTVETGKTFIRTADGGKNWLLDSIKSPENYNLQTIDATDENTCYATMTDFIDGSIQL